MVSEYSLRSGAAANLKVQAALLSDEIWRSGYYSMDGSRVFGISEEALTDFAQLYRDTQEDVNSIIDALDDETLKGYCKKITDQFPGLHLNQYVYAESENTLMVIGAISYLVFTIIIYRAVANISKTRQFAAFLSAVRVLNDKLIAALETPNFSAWIELSENSGLKQKTWKNLL